MFKKIREIILFFIGFILGVILVFLLTGITLPAVLKVNHKRLEMISLFLMYLN